MANNESTMKWKVDIGQLTKAMQEAKRSIKIANAEFKTATAGMDRWSKSTTGLEAKLKQLNSTLPQQKKILTDLEKQYKITADNMGENSKEAVDLRVKIEEQRATIVKTETNIKKYNDQLDQMQTEQAQSETAYGKLNKTIEEQQGKVDDLKAAYKNAVVQYGENSKEAKSLASEIERLSGELSDNKKKMQDADKSADDLDKSIEDAGDSAKEAANGGFTVLKGAMADLVAQGISKAIEGLKQLAGKVIEVGKQSINEYANYEQLVGGVETLFKDSADIVEGYADRAYKTAGMSANEYMETVTSFSASLLQGLNGDTAKAAKISDMAIQDMSDNANKMGTDIQSLQNAYQGFAKGNFTMLDNLKLGYGGTKTEMLRLVKDAGVVNDSVKSIDDVSFDQIIEAIHIVQDEMGITGTTSKEAADTIEGSKKSMMASWSNLLKEFAKSDGDVGAAFETFAESVITYGKNLLPRIETLVNNAIDFARQKLEEKAPELLNFIDGVVEGIKTVMDFVKKVVDFIVNYGDIILAVIGGIAAATAIYLGYTTALTIMTKGWMALTVVQKAVAAGQKILNVVMAANPIGIVIALIAGLVAAFVILWNKSDKFREFWINLWEKIKNAASVAKEKISGWIDNIKTKFQEFKDKATEIKDKIVETWNKIKEKTQNLKDKVVEYFEKIKTGIKEKISNAKEKVLELFGNIKEGISEKISSAKEKVSNAVSKIKSLLSFEGLKKKVSELFNGIKEKITAPIDKAKELVDKAVSKIKGIFPISMGKIFSGIKLPHFKISGGKIPWGIGGAGEKPTVGIEWYAKGGVINKKSIIGVGEDGAEAVVPLEKNTQWISKVVREMVDQLDIMGVKNALQGNVNSMNGNASSGEIVKTQNVTFNQYNTSPKPLDRLSVYRETNSLLFSAKVRLQNV